jgi:hypothetical protein
MTDRTRPAPIRLAPPLAGPAIAVAAAIAALGGCSSDGVQVDASTRSVAFAADFDGGALLRGERSGVAVLPALAPYQQGLGPLTGMTLMRALERNAPGLRVMPSGVVLGKLNAAGLGSEWRELATGYVVSGVLERKALEEVAEAAGARFVLMPMLGTMNSKTDTRFTFAGLVVDRTTSTTVDVSLQVWDSATGELSWASTGWSSVEAEVVLATRASLNRALEAAWTQMVIDLVAGRSRSAFSALERGTDLRDGADGPSSVGNAGAAPALGHGGDSP